MNIKFNVRKSILILLLIAFVISLAACTDNHTKNDGLTAVCSNGRFVGTAEKETGVLSFKGLPYAKPPIGNLRWKAPCEPDDSDEVFVADTFGKSSIQYNWHSEPIQTEVGEDCLTLNIWTKDLSTENKTVMVFFHGGAFAWGGSSEVCYSGQNIVDAHDDVILVTCNYRIGLMGFANFEGVDGGENYPDSQNLGVLDAIMALRWIKKNISAFGGNPNNITIFGESAGGGLVTALLATDYAGELFQRAIIESGSANLLINNEQSSNYNYNVQYLMEITGAKSMDDLLALTEEELIAANELALDENGTTINDLSATPVRGKSPIAVDPYEAMKNGKAQNVDILIGTNLNEMTYWVNEMGDIPMEEMDEDGIAENLAIFEQYFINPLYDSVLDRITDEETENLQTYLSLHGDEEALWAKTNLLGEIYYRQPSIAVAENHSQSTGAGKTYMYLFERENESFDFYGSCHAVELAYVFRNLDDSCDNLDRELSDNICSSWVNFAKSGNPSIESATWEPYDAQNRSTMIMSNDCTMRMENDPYGQERQLLSSLVPYYLIPMGS